MNEKQCPRTDKEEPKVLGFETGYPRPKAKWNNNKWKGTLRTTGAVKFNELPVPWVSAHKVADKSTWAQFDDDRIKLALNEAKPLCSVCGEALPEFKIFGVFTLFTVETLEEQKQFGKSIGEELVSVDGPGMHARCALLAAVYCPFFEKRLPDERFVSWTGQGTGHVLPEESNMTLSEWKHKHNHLWSSPIKDGYQHITWQEVVDLAKQDQKLSKGVCPYNQNKF